MKLPDKTRTSPVYNGFPVWTHQEFKSKLREAFLEQMEGKGRRSVLVMGDSCIGKFSSITEFCTEMAQELGLAQTAKKYGQSTGYVDLSELEVAGRDQNAFEQLLKKDIKSSLALLKLNPGFVDYAGGIRFFEEQDAVGVLVLKLAYGLNYYDPRTWDGSYACKLFKERFLSQLVSRGVWENTRQLSSKVLIVATGIAQDGLTSGLGSEFHSKGLLYLTPETWLSHAEARGIDRNIIDFIMSNPYRNLGINRLLNDEGLIASQADKERWDSEQSHLPWSEQAFKRPNPYMIEDVSRSIPVLCEMWESMGHDDGESVDDLSDERDSTDCRGGYKNFYEFLYTSVGGSCGATWAREFTNYLLSR